MPQFIKLYIQIAAVISFSIVVNGCSMLTPLKKPEIGPAGLPVESKTNPPFFERFTSPPRELYDLEATAGIIFASINTEKWLQAENGTATLQDLWFQSKNLIGDKKGVKEADGSLKKLAADVRERKKYDSFSSLIKFMANIGDIGKSYKLSPLSDIIGVGNTIRAVSYYVQDNAWSKAKVKIKELEGVWGQAKPSMEKIGILGEVTKTHSAVKQLKDAVEGENKESAEEQLTNINESMGAIREYYRIK